MPSCHFSLSDKSYYTPCILPTSCACAELCDQFRLPRQNFCFNETLAVDKSIQSLYALAPTSLPNNEGLQGNEAVELPQSLKGAFIDPSECPHGCSGRGVCNKETKKCSCAWIYGGDGCEETLDLTVECINGCSGKGQCTEGFCKCTPGYFGIDCSLYRTEKGSTRSVQSNVPFAWAPPSSSAAASSPLSLPKFGPRVYVYDLPPYFNTWQLQQSAFQGWAEAQLFLERLLNSPYRVLDPEQADYFYVPLFLGNRGPASHPALQWAIDYIRTRFPFWDRQAGADHIFLTSGSFGNCGQQPWGELDYLLANSISLTLFGQKGNMRGQEDGPCFRPGLDVLLPPAHTAEVLSHSPYLQDPPAVPTPGDRPTLLLFVNYQRPDPNVAADEDGEEGADVPGLQHQQEAAVELTEVEEEAEEAVRKFLMLFDDRERETGVRVLHFTLPSLDESVPVRDWPSEAVQDMLTSRFCLVPGMRPRAGWMAAATQAALLGCVPVLLQPNVAQPFDGDALDWASFSLSLPPSSLPSLVQTLNSVPETVFAQKIAALESVWPRLVWAGTNFNPVYDSTPAVQRMAANKLAKTDAFATVMDVLKQRLMRNKPSGARGGAQGAGKARKPQAGGDSGVLGGFLRGEGGTAAARSRASSKCAEGCSLHGTCNEELGRCDCPPNMAGDDCSRPALPSCLLLGSSTIGSFANASVDGHGGGTHSRWMPCHLPSSCACARECDAYRFPHPNLCYDDVPARDRETGLVDPALLYPAKGDTGRLMTLDLDGRGNELSDPMPVAEAAKAAEGDKSVAMPALPANYSDPGACPYGCSGHGGCNSDLGTCECPLFYYGTGCEEKPGWVPFDCYNECSGKGLCMEGTCKCQPGFFGIDCSMYLDVDGHTEIVPQPVFRWAPLVAPASALSKTVQRPRIYVYDLPPYFTTWSVLHSAQEGARDEALLFLERLLTSPYRTVNPEEADFFYMPLSFVHRGDAHADLLSWAVQYVRDTWPYWRRSQGADHLFLTNRHWGACEMGELGKRDPLLANSIALTAWGYAGNMYMENGAETASQCFIPGQDVAIPPQLPESFYRYLFTKAGGRDAAAAAAEEEEKKKVEAEGGEGHATEGAEGGAGAAVTEETAGAAVTEETAGAAKQDEGSSSSRPLVPPKRDMLLYFQGYSGRDLHKHLGYEFSFGVRQLVFDLFEGMESTTGIFVDGASDYSDNFFRRMESAVFCLAPSAWGWDNRATMAAALGCIPVIIQPNVTMPLEGVGRIRWDKIAVRLGMKDIPRLSRILRNIRRGDILRRQAALRDIWPHFTWASPQWNPVPFLPEAQQLAAGAVLARYDAFSGIMQGLNRIREAREKVFARKTRNGGGK